MSTPAAAYDVISAPGARQRDVASHLHAGEVDIGHRAIGVGAGGLQVGAEPGDGEHPPAAGVPVGEPGREDQRVVRRERQRDEIAEPWRGRVAGRGGHDGARRRGPQGERPWRQFAAGRRQRHFGDVGVEQGKQCLCLRVAEAHVVLHEPRTAFRQHQPGVQESDVRRAGGCEVIEHRLHERSRELTDVVRHRRRRVRAHPARVRPGVALADALVILSQRERCRRAPVAHRDQRALGTRHHRFEHEWPGGGGRGDRRDRLVGRCRHGDPLAARQPVELHDDRLCERVQPRHGCVRRAGLETGEPRSRDAELRRQLTGVALRRLQPGERRDGPEARHAAPGALVGDTRHQRRLRPGDHEIGLRLARRRQLAGNRHLVAVLRAGPGDGPLPPAVADHEHVHRARTARSTRFWVAKSSGARSILLCEREPVGHSTRSRSPRGAVVGSGSDAGLRRESAEPIPAASAPPPSGRARSHFAIWARTAPDPGLYAPRNVLGADAPRSAAQP